MQLKALTTFQIFFSLKAYPVELGQQGWVQKEKKGLEQESSSCHWHSQPATDTEACLGRFYPGADLPTSGRIVSRKLTPLIGFILVCAAPAEEAHHWFLGSLDLPSAGTALPLNCDLVPWCWCKQKQVKATHWHWDFLWQTNHWMFNTIFEKPACSVELNRWDRLDASPYQVCCLWNILHITDMSLLW